MARAKAKKVELPDAFKFLVSRPKEETAEEKEEKQKDMTFAFLNSINNTKINIFNEETAPYYNRWKISRFLASDQETCVDVNEVNSRPKLTDEQHYLYLLHSVRRKDRRLKYFRPKRAKDVNLEAVCKYFNCSNIKGKEYMALLSPPELEEIRAKTFTGGRK